MSSLVRDREEEKMEEQTSGLSFSEMVTQHLTPESRELWAPMSDEFERDGPEAVRNYLDAERDRLEGSTRSLLEQFKRS